MEIFTALSTLFTLLQSVSAIIETVLSIINGVEVISKFLEPIMPAIMNALPVVAIIVLVLIVLLAIAVVLTILSLIVLVVLCEVAMHLFTVFPLFLLGCKAKCKYAWLVLFPIPFVYDYVLFTAPGKRPYRLFGKWLPIKDRWIPWMLYLCCYIAAWLIAAVATAFPAAGLLLLLVLPVGWYLYALAVKDMLSVTREGFAGNLLAAIVAVLADDLIFLGTPLAKALVMYTVCFKKRLPDPVEPTVVSAPEMPATPVVEELPETPEIVVEAEAIIE